MQKLFIIPFLLLSVACLSQSMKFAKTNSTAGIRLTEDVKYFSDSTVSLQIKDITDQPGLFSAFDKPKSLYSFSKSGIWLRCKIRNENAEKKFLYSLIDNHRIESILFFVQKENGTLIRYPRGGWGVPLWQKAFPHYKNVFPFEIAPGEELTFYIFTRTLYQPFNVPIIFTGHQDLTAHIMVTALSDGFVLIMSLFVFLISLFLLYESKKKAQMYIWYCVFSLHLFLYFFLRNGILYFNQHQLNPILDYIAELPTVVNVFSYAFFALGFMESVKVNPIYTKFSRKALAVTGIASLTAYFIGPIPNATVIFWARGALLATFLVVVFYPLIQGIRQRNRDAYLFLVMLTPPLIVYILLVWASDISPSGGVSDYMLLLKLLIFLEASLMMFSVFYKSGRIKKDLFKKIAENEKQILQTQIDVQESERQRIASDLHDELGANMATIKRDISELETMQLPEPAKSVIQRAEQLISQTNEDVRRITHNLMPPHFEVIGLKDSLWHLTTRADCKNLKFEFITFGTIKKLSYEEEINLYRIVSELIHNIQKHADASMASVQLIYFLDRLTINVEDNGRGFEASKVNESGIGLSTMRIRADYIGATLNLDSGPSGTSATIELTFK